MKFSCIIIFVIGFGLLYSQKVTGYFRDLITNEMDTIYFGYQEKATIGIDSSLGEKNIRDVPLKPLDIRIFQRDSNDFYCLHPFGGRNVHGDIVYDSVFYSPSFDSKINYRSKDSVNRYFEIFMHYQNNINYSFNLDKKFKFFLEKVITYIDVCPYSIPIEIGKDTFFNDLRAYGGNTIGLNYYMIWVFKDSITLPTRNQEVLGDSGINLYPNLFKDLISIELSGNYSQLEIFDMNGKVFFKDIIIRDLNFYEIVSKQWPPDIYLLRILNRDRKEVFIKKLIKI